MSTQQNSSSKSKKAKKLMSRAPYEQIFIRAIDRLTSQVLIFLLSWGIIIVALSIIMPAIPTRILAIICFLSALGIAAYMWQEKLSLLRKNNTRMQKVKVKAEDVSGSTYVSGTRGMSSSLPDEIDVALGTGRDNSKVIGLDFSDSQDTNQTHTYNNNQEIYLLELFRQLNEHGQRQVIKAASNILDERI